MALDRSVTIIELLRHAQAGKRGMWHGPDRDRPLDELGRRQAEALADDLEGSPRLSAIVSSSYRRCTMTVEPLARRLGLEIRTDVALEELEDIPITDTGSAWVNAAWLGGRGLGLVDRCVDQPPGEGPRRILLCSHGDVVPALLAGLAGRDGIPLDSVRCPKGARYTLRFEGRRCVDATPVPAPRVDLRLQGGT